MKGGVGATLFGFGVCCVVESGFLKHDGAPKLLWIAAGTLSLIIMIVGLIMLIKAGVMENELKKSG